MFPPPAAVPTPAPSKNGTPPQAASAALQLLAYAQERNWAGHDPYDALNSPWCESLGWANNRVSRIVLTQLLKRSPFNFRSLLRIRPTQNPKALALFLAAALRLEKAGLLRNPGLISDLIALLIALRSPSSQYFCWGYSFPWQTRSVLVPRGAPNLVCTTFAAQALLDAHARRGDKELLSIACSAADYIATELYYEDGPAASFSYPRPDVKTKVHNANFLASALLARVYRHTGNDKLAGSAIKAARYSASRQRPDGSWDYGELPSQCWIDNFHTGYNLSALRALDRYLETSEFSPAANRGFEFYVNHFFRSDGAPRYFHNRTYPIDIHCCAQSLLTLSEFGSEGWDCRQLLGRTYAWTMKNMRDAAGYFYYRKYPYMTIRTSYMRWSQAWMMLALASLAEADEHPRGATSSLDSTAAKQEHPISPS